MKLYIGRLLDYIILCLIILLGIIIRLLPLNSKYPIGCDSGAYFSYTARFAETWPFIPKTLLIIGGIPATEGIPPLQPWLTAGFYKLSGLDLFRVIQATPISIWVFTALAIYFLTIEVTFRRDIALMTIFICATLKLYFSIIYPTYAVRTELGILFITLFFLFMLRAIKVGEVSKNLRKSTMVNSFLASLSFFAVVATHDFSTFSLGIIIGSFVVLGLLFAKRRFIAAFRPVFISIFPGIIFSIPIFIVWKGFYLERVYRIFYSSPNITAMTTLKEHISHLWEIMGPVPYGYIPSLFAVIGLILLLFQKPKVLGHYLIFAWLLPMCLLAKLDLLGIYSPLVPHRLLAYGMVPLSITAAIGVIEIIAWGSRLVGSLGHFAVRKAAIFGIIGLIIISQVFEAATTIMQAPGARPVITKAGEEAMLWLKENTPEDSVIFATIYAPFATGGYIAGIAGRAYIAARSEQLIAGPYLEYQRNLEALEVISLRNPKLVSAILDKYAQTYSKGYLFVANKPTLWYSPRREAIPLEKLKSYYRSVFENSEIIIFELY